MKYRLIPLYEDAKYEFYQNKLTPEEFNELNAIYPKYSVWIIKQYLDLREVKDPASLSNLISRIKAIAVPALTKYELLLRYKFFQKPPTHAEQLPNGEQEIVWGCPKNLIKYQELQKTNLDNLRLFCMCSDVVDFLNAQEFRDYKKKAKIQTIYKDDNWWIAHPENHFGCIYLGSSMTDNTRPEADWCVSKKNSSSLNYYNRYTSSKGLCPILFIQKLDDKDRWLVGGNDNLINDSTDDDINNKSTGAEFPNRNRQWLMDSLPQEAIQKADEFSNGGFSKLFEYEEEEEGVVCERCNNVVPENEATIIDGENETWCDDCTNDHSFICSSCDCRYNDNHIGLSDSSSIYCEGCSEHMFRCPDCDEIYSMDDSVEGDDEEMYCSACVEDHKSDYINDIGFKVGSSDEEKIEFNILGKTESGSVSLGEVAFFYLSGRPSAGWDILEKELNDLSCLDKTPIDFKTAEGLYYCPESSGLLDSIKSYYENEKGKSLSREEQNNIKKFAEKFFDKIEQDIRSWASNLGLSHQEDSFDYAIIDYINACEYEVEGIGVLVNSSDPPLTLPHENTYRIDINDNYHNHSGKTPIRSLVSNHKKKNKDDWSGPGTQQWLNPDAQFDKRPEIWESLLDVRRLGRL